MLKSVFKTLSKTTSYILFLKLKNCSLQYKFYILFAFLITMIRIFVSMTVKFIP